MVGHIMCVIHLLIPFGVIEFTSPLCSLKYEDEGKKIKFSLSQMLHEHLPCATCYGNCYSVNVQFTACCRIRIGKYAFTEFCTKFCIFFLNFYQMYSCFSFSCTSINRNFRLVMLCHTKFSPNSKLQLIDSLKYSSDCLKIRFQVCF